MDKDSAQILKAAMGEEVAPKPARKTIPPPISVDHWTPAVLLERAKYLREIARHGDGLGSEVLHEYPRHFSVLTFRDRTGESEIHEKFADMFYILAGSTTLVTGGKLVNARGVGPGEIRGDAIEGGTQQELRVGDVAHVPAGTPHHMVVSGEKTVTYFVMKNQESD